MPEAAVLIPIPPSGRFNYEAPVNEVLMNRGANPNEPDGRHRGNVSDDDTTDGDELVRYWRKHCQPGYRDYQDRYLTFSTASTVS